MSKIIKKLKYGQFEYDEENKEFTIKTTPHGESEGGYAVGANNIKLNKIYAFAFMRFVVRMAQRNWLRNFNKRELNLTKEEATNETEEDPNQLTLFENE